MNRNLYAPPTSPVDDVQVLPATMERPDQVWTAVTLLWLSLAIGVANTFVQWQYFLSLATTEVLLLTQGFTLALFIWVTYKIWHGRNWARIMFTVMTIIGTPLLVMKLPEVFERSTVGGWINIAQTVMQLSAIYLLFFSAGREWFRRRSLGSNNSLKSDLAKPRALG